MLDETFENLQTRKMVKNQNPELVTEQEVKAESRDPGTDVDENESSRSSQHPKRERRGPEHDGS